MRINDFHILVITHKQDNHITRNTIYDDIDTFIEEIYENNHKDYEYTEIPQEQWNINDCINITSELLEDVNKHSLADEPSNIVRMMKESNISDDKILVFMKKYMNNMFDKYGY